MYMYIPCTYMFMRVCNYVNMYIHVCTMFRHASVCHGTSTVLPILVPARWSGFQMYSLRTEYILI